MALAPPFQGAFFRAVLCIHRNQFDKAERYIENTRGLVSTELSALAGESYNRCACSVLCPLHPPHSAPVVAMLWV